MSTPLTLDPRTYQRGLSCVHCGLCLPACPTYTQTGHEADSPRGRIQLMLALADHKIQPTAGVMEHLDLCLDCRACETACPSGVVYHELIEETRAKLAPLKPATRQDRLMRFIFFHLFTKPTRLKLSLLPARLLQKLKLYNLLRSLFIMLLPPQLQKMEQMLPASGPLWPKSLPRLTKTTTQFRNVKRGDEEMRQSKRVAFFPGCVGSVMYGKVNQMAVDLLAAAGADVVVQRAQKCCGAIHHHNNAHHTAQKLARKNIDAMLATNGEKIDMIVTDIAGCGAMLREYDHLLRDDKSYAYRAQQFSSRVRDISEALLELGLPALPHAVKETVTYHDACHLAHAQKVTSAPRKILSQIPGLKLIPLPESDMCCGAAGTYNLTQPVMATDLARRKLGHISSTQCTTCATGNVGCAMHLQSQADVADMDITIIHPIELLHRAVFGPAK
ncbi:MAG TPA: (Fe-S)-binding protein [Tepidisphaeraceae bacterium]|jgi:glycolate oxidase iron-sulfur subunit|nr:(Fe-S)-binding protein [Tepidisphaeraceae bacterium]